MSVTLLIKVQQTPSNTLPANFLFIEVIRRLKKKEITAAGKFGRRQYGKKNDLQYSHGSVGSHPLPYASIREIPLRSDEVSGQTNGG